mmetsp:Transcript_16553/g.23992  ORF Transcript_16553/g.23992 Transcript_16553/m.23992 type:complete len:307 (+) Transcript_16553:1446-2366(+)
MESETNILQEIQVAKNFQSLPPHALYIAGSARYKTSLKPQVILKFLEQFYGQAKNFPSEKVSEVESLVFQGKIGEAKRLVKELESQTQYIEYKELEQKALEIMQAIQKEEKDSLLCASCSGSVDDRNVAVLEFCSHIFHTNCLKVELETQILQKGISVGCPQCQAEVSASEMQNYCSRDIFGAYQELTLKSLLEKDQINIFQCPECGEKFDSEGQATVVCIRCEAQVCTLCNTTKFHCRCTNEPELKFCPMCNLGNRFYGGNKVTCRGCNTGFCPKCACFKRDEYPCACTQKQFPFFSLSKFFGNN